jgi:hypothetical membrane protein
LQNPKYTNVSGSSEADERDSNLRLGASFLVSAGVIFIIFNTIAEGIYPNYSVKTNALSDLGAIGAPTRFLWDGQLFVSGILTLIGMILVFYKSSWSMNIRSRKAVGIIYLVPAIASVMVSLIPENSIPLVHTIAAFITFIVGGVSGVYAYRLTRSPFKYFSIVLGIVTLVAASALGASASLGFGLVERLVVYPFVVWGIIFGSYLMARSS